MFFFCRYLLEGTQVFINICRGLDPPDEIECVTLQDYFNRKQSRDLLDQVFMTNTYCRYINYELMNCFSIWEGQQIPNDKLIQT